MHLEDPISEAVKGDSSSSAHIVPDEEPPLYSPPGFETPPPPTPSPREKTERRSSIVTRRASSVPENIHVPEAPFVEDMVHLGSEPQNVLCPACHFGVRTYTKTRVGSHAGYPQTTRCSEVWDVGVEANAGRVWSAICCVTCGVIAAFLPLVLPSCQDVEHICPNCTYPTL
jgi:LITAF-like zinc ribbon domain